jgi:hypothetical protein
MSMKYKMRLQEILLTHGGSEVLGLGIDRVLPNFDVEESLVEPLVEFGRTYSTDNIRLRKRGMDPCRCHDNAYGLFKAGKEPAFATGFALTNNDGFWRPHSWCLSIKGNVVETTTLRDQYFGVYYLQGDES